MKVRSSVQILNSIFFLSGAAALTYQTCWQRVLGLYYGVGPISTAIVVSVFMFGLGMGALAARPLWSRFSSPIRPYIAIEALIALFGFVSLPLLIGVGKLTAGSDYSLMLLYVTLLLLIPTVLMGATLPIVV
jgi:spermidine synthase